MKSSAELPRKISKAGENQRYNEVSGSCCKDILGLYIKRKQNIYLLKLCKNGENQCT